MSPGVRPAGAVAWSWVSLVMVKAALRWLNCTRVAPTKCVPVRVTTLPSVRLVGVKDWTVGARGASTVKVGEVADPLGVATWTAPVVAPPGTTASTRVALMAVKEKAARPLKVTAVAPERLVPVKATRVPAVP